MKNLLLLLGIALVITGSGGFLVNQKLPQWKDGVYRSIEVFEEELRFSKNPNEIDWPKIASKLSSVPNFYPFSNLKYSIWESREILEELDSLSKNEFINLEESEISTDKMLGVFDSLKKISKSLENIEKKIAGFYDFILSDNQIENKNKALDQISSIREKVEEVLNFEKILREFIENKERILVILQNENEPRSSGGFMGSFIIVDFKEDNKISWEFRDIYSIDRNIPERVQSEAPDFFHGLSKTISLRDANFYPDFATSSEKIRDLMSYSGEKTPDTIIAINTRIIREILKITGPVKLNHWGVLLDEFNFDLVLQFLVESKIAGRYDVKSPVMDFAKELINSLNHSLRKDFSSVKKFNIEKFLQGKNILANSKDRRLQKLFEKWNLDGKVSKKRNANNFMQFDFVSIGANKSEKFVWTKITNNSDINSEGKVKNSMKIIRNHALAKNEINELLGAYNWSDNIKELLDEELIWKLGAGQNRTIMRISVPKFAKLLSQNNPSGTIKEYDGDEFKIFEIPMYVLPGEKLNISLEYETYIEEGSHNWRPYFLQMVGSPAKEKTTFLQTITTTDNGKFSAETYNIGKPVYLIDQDFRAIIEF